MKLDQYTLNQYSPGAPYWKQFLWYVVGSPFVRDRLIPSLWKCWMLRAFGASIGQGVRIKPGVRIKFPWRLTVGNYVWIGECAWLDNLAPITLENHVCLSQSVYLCTGNHDWSHPHFQLRIAPILIQQGCWIAARSTIGPGVTVKQGAVLTLGSVAGKSLDSMTIYAGNPAQPIQRRTFNPTDSTIQNGATASLK